MKSDGGADIQRFEEESLQGQDLREILMPDSKEFVARVWRYGSATAAVACEPGNGLIIKLSEMSRSVPRETLGTDARIRDEEGSSSFPPVPSSSREVGRLGC